MRGADIAMGHALKIVLGCSLAHAELGGTFAGDILKSPAECAQAVPAGLECDVDDRQIGVAQQCFCPLDPPRQQVAMWRQAKGFLEGPREMRFGYSADRGQPLDRPLLLRGSIHAVLRAQKAAYERYILSHMA